jgi:hypothetical protein
MMRPDSPARPRQDPPVPGRLAAAAVGRRVGEARLLLLWLGYIIAVWLIAAYAAGAFVSHRLPPPPAIATAPLSAWDGANYTEIARDGYSLEPGAARRFAFFPLMPALARLAGGFAHAPLAGILISQLLMLGCLLLLREWRRDAPGAPRAPPGDLRAEPGFWLLVAPLAFFYAVFYAESLFLFLVLGALVLWRRGRIGAAALALVLAGLSRPTAICLPALFLPAILDADTRRSGLLLAAAPLAGMALYLGYVGMLTGSPFGYSRLQAELWGHGWSVPFLPVLLELKRVLALAFSGTLPPRDLLIRPVVLIGVVLLLASCWRRLEPEFRAYAIVSLLFIHAQVPSLSSARYDLAIFPVFIALARTPLARSRTGVLLAIAFLILQLAFMLDFMVWRWAA